jgi:hypothetical protein
MELVGLQLQKTFIPQPMNNPVDVGLRRHPNTFCYHFIARRHTMLPDVAFDEVKYLLFAHTQSLNTFENVRKWCKR